MEYSNCQTSRILDTIRRLQYRNSPLKNKRRCIICQYSVWIYVYKIYKSPTLSILTNSLFLTILELSTILNHCNYGGNKRNVIDIHSKVGSERWKRGRIRSPTPSLSARLATGATIWPFACTGYWGKRTLRGVEVYAKVLHIVGNGGIDRIL